MTDTFKRVNKSLIELLRDEDQRVIALKGNWGTGKTYLWRVVEAELFRKRKAVEQPIYVSLFGAKTINELKLRILRSAYLSDTSGINKLIEAGSGFAKQLFQRATKFSLEEVAFLWLPKVLADRLIVIDDVERKHECLDIDEFLGLLAEYSETHNTRFLILLNTDKLKDTDMWETLREKVIDAELVLEPSAAESFDAAAQGQTSRYLQEVRAAIATLNVNNIRVIKRVLRMIARIEEVRGVSKIPTSCWVPSSVLLTASHYRAIDKVPPGVQYKKVHRLSG